MPRAVTKTKRWERRLPELVRAVEQMPPSYFSRFLERIERVLLLDYEAHDIRLVVRTKAEFMRLRAFRKEPWTVTWLEETMKPGAVLYDIGANVGAYSLIAAGLSNGMARVVAIEPAFANFNALCRNIMINHAGDSVIPLQLALAARTGTADFFYANVQSGAGGHAVNAPVGGGGTPFKSAHRQRVLTYRLDDLIGHIGLPEPTHLKIDVDGAELEVLDGAAETLVSPRLRSVMIEIDRRFDEPGVSRRVSAGFDLTERIDKRNKRGQMYHFFYALFSRRTAAEAAPVPSPPRPK
jgi:FkbM family methyltransferase